MIGSLTSPGYSRISDRDSARDCFLMIWFFFKENPVSHWFTGWVYANVIIHLSIGESQGYSPRRIRGSVYILVYSLPLRWIITRYLLFSIHAWPYARFFQKQGHAMLCYTWLCCVVLYCTVLCCAVCYTILDKLQFFNKMRACVRAWTCEFAYLKVGRRDRDRGASSRLGGTISDSILGHKTPFLTKSL